MVRQSGEPAAVVGTALESDDPPQSLARAEALLARRITLDHQPSEAEISTVAAPDGTQIFFCNTSTSDPRSWLGDFNHCPEVSPVGMGRPGIDHVALSQKLDSFDEGALFYRSVLGLSARDRQEVASPDGLIRSRAFTDERSPLRFVLNSPVIGRAGMAPHLRRDQHIAFACADLLALAQAFVERNVRVVQISDNYYDDLAARLDLDEQLLVEIRDLSVLYDSDGSGGEFLHLYVDIPGARAFFEFVERRGGYDGYGAANSPVSNGRTGYTGHSAGRGPDQPCGSSTRRRADFHANYGGLEALREVTIEARAGQVLGLVGDNGAGKSTLLEDPRRSAGPKRGPAGPRRQASQLRQSSEAVEAGITTVYQDLALAMQRTVVDNFFLGRERLVRSPARRGLGGPTAPA